MALARLRRREPGLEYWPGLVGALSALLLAMIFLLSVVMLAQFFLARDVTGKDSALKRLDHEIADLSALLVLERAGKAQAEALSAETANRAAATFLGMKQTLESETRAATAAQAEVEVLNQRIAASRAQLTAQTETLATADRRDREQQAKITDLGARLDIALAQKVQDLERYRSDFFIRLRQILGERPEIRVAGDRFIVQAEVLFGSGRSRIDPAGRIELDKIAAALIDLDGIIPNDITWVLQVDGHTDTKPIRSAQFSSNWALSAARATAVVQYLISKGVSPQRLAAAGFGEFHPLELNDGEDANRRNRRIELKITEK